MKLLALLLLPLALLAVTACGGDDDAGDGDLRKVTVMLEWTPNTNHAGIYIAKEKGWYREAGLDVEIVEPGAGGVEAVVGTGNADFGISVQEAVIPARGQGVPIVAIAAIIQHNTSSLMALESDNIRRPRDLDGKTYGGFGGPLEKELISRLSRCDGGNPDTIRFVDVGDVDYLIGMEQNRYDFVWIFEAWDGVRAKEIEKKAVTTIPFIDYQQCVPDWYTPLIITNENHVKNDKELVRDFMAATSRGYAEAMRNPQASVDAILANASETDRALLEASAKYLATRYVDQGRRWGEQDLATWQRFEKFLREAGLTEKEIDVQAAFTNEFLPDR